MCLTSPDSVKCTIKFPLFSSGVPADLFTYNAVLTVYSEEGHLEEAEKLLIKMKECGCTPDRVVIRTPFFSPTMLYP